MVMNELEVINTIASAKVQIDEIIYTIGDDSTVQSINKLQKVNHTLDSIKLGMEYFECPYCGGIVRVTYRGQWLCDDCRNRKSEYPNAEVIK